MMLVLSSSVGIGWASASAAAALPVFLHVTLVRAGRGELAQLVADHGVGHEDRDVLAAVVDGDRVTDHVRHDHRPARPGLDDVVRALLVLGVHLLLQVVVDEGALLQAARHLSYFLPLPDLRRRMIWESEALRLRVRPSGLPQGETGWRPPEVLPSPPPCGWSTGFMTTPRTVGRLPFHRMRPALPQLMFDCSALPTSPTVARQRTSTKRISPEGMRSVAREPSRATSWALMPAERAILAPPPGRSSIAWIVVPTGMWRSGRLLPVLMSALAPDSTSAPCRRSFGAMM